MRGCFKYLLLLSLLGGIGFGVYGYQTHGDFSSHWNAIKKDVPIAEKAVAFLSDALEQKEDDQQGREGRESVRGSEEEDDAVDPETTSWDKDEEDQTEEDPENEEDRDGEPEDEKTEEQPEDASGEPSEEQLQKFRDLLTRAGEEMDRARYERALKMLNKPSDSDIPSRLRKLFHRERQKAEELKNVIEMMDVDLSTDPPVSVHAKLYNGSEIEGILKKETDSKITIKMHDSDLTHDLDKAIIKNLDKKSPEETREMFLDKFQTKKQDLPDPPTVIELYNLAEFGLKHGIVSESADVLDQAYKLSGTGLANQIMNHKAGSLYEYYKFYKSRGQTTDAERNKKKLLEKYPKSRYARKITGKDVASADNAGEDQNQSSGSPSDSSGDGSEDTDQQSDGSAVKGESIVNPEDYDNPSVKREVKKAVNIYDQAMKHFEKASREERDLEKRKTSNNKARDKLVEARGHVRKAQDLVEGEDENLKDLFQEIQDKYGTCYRRAKVWAGFHKQK